MSENSTGLDYDGVTDFQGGVNSGVDPKNIPSGQLAWGVNISTRGGRVSCRPPWIRKAILDIPDGCVQGAMFYLSPSQEGQIILAAAGRLYLIRPEFGFSVTDITPASGPNSYLRLKAYMLQAEQFAIIQDGISAPIVYDGATSRRTSGNEIQTGTFMAYSQGRIWYAVNQGKAFRATDIVGSSSGTATYNYTDSILKETENTFLNGGGDFAVPDSAGRITGMLIPATLDTSLGQGPLQIFTNLYCFSVNAPVERAIWQDVAHPIVTVSQVQKGAIGPIVTVNGDGFYRAPDGIRSFIVARRDYQQGWANRPISRNVKRALDTDGPILFPFGTATLFDNRLMFSVWGRMGPQGSSQIGRGVWYEGLVVIDFDPVTGLDGGDAAPEWQGMWTGLRIFQLVTGTFKGKERCFAFALADDNTVQIWELDDTRIWDNNTTPIQWNFETSVFGKETRKTNRFMIKRLTSLKSDWVELEDEATWTVRYRSDSHACWQTWQAGSFCAQMETCEPEECLTLPNLQPQYRVRHSLRQPPDQTGTPGLCNTVTKRPFKDLYTTQLRFEMSGKVTLDDFRLDYNITMPEDMSMGDCDESTVCTSLDCCPFDSTIYHIPTVEVT